MEREAGRKLVGRKLPPRWRDELRACPSVEPFAAAVGNEGLQCVGGWPLAVLRCERSSAAGGARCRQDDVFCVGLLGNRVWFGMKGDEGSCVSEREVSRGADGFGLSAWDVMLRVLGKEGSLRLGVEGWDCGLL